MCGLAGLLSRNFSDAELSNRLGLALETLGHRGPDDRGTYFDQSAGLALGHRRLAIIDPEHGRQPMTTEDGQLTVVFNGVIYNYLELRRELTAKGHPIRTYSDTEVLLYAYREWGISCLGRFLGMFAFVIWDRASKRLFCARDRIGIKPFYFVHDGVGMVFGSEIKAILATGMVRAQLNTQGLQDYLTFQFCLGDKTMFKGIRKLEPGHCLVAQLAGDHVNIEIRPYWDVSYDVDETHDEEWFVDQLAGLIEDAVRLHLRSDVPLGAHLSGGLDSSTLVCLAANLLKGERLKTFTGAFPEGPAFDETRFAKMVADFSGTKNYETYIDGAELPEVLPRLMYLMDEPMAGPGMIPQYYVSKLAAQHVKVVLSGQGGDELFIGYARYLVAYLEKCLAGAIFETAHRARYAVSLESIMANLPSLQTYGSMLQAFWRDGLFDSDDRRYFKLVDRSDGMPNLLADDTLQSDYSPFEAFSNIFNRADLKSLVNRMTYFDLKGSLPALLHVEDRMSMSVSVESRVPLLDHRIVEFMARIPPNIKFAGGRLKHMLKASARNTVPSEILERKDKMGFPTPLTRWTKGVAREFVRDTLLSERACQRGIFSSSAVERALENESEFGRIVWGLLCLELWHRLFIDGDGNAR